MTLPASFLDELRARTPMQGLVARRVQLKKSGRNWTGCCPFHNEKTPSFYVYDDGYHCFGCGAHGDAIGFVMQTQGLGFPDAVAALAAEAGLDVPRPSLREVEREEERLGLQAVLEAAQAEFVRLLRTPEGAAGLAYLQRRGLSEATIGGFGLGWSGAGRGSLVAALRGQGIEPSQLEEAGLLRAADEDGPARELFWGRIMFPIRNRQGRIISFGGRTLGDGKPKYINGPETPLFLKRQALFALDLAREGVRRGPLIVAEGYMDVIALHQAGFAGAVAPLGTALGAEQLQMLWRLSPVPVLCFDGDAAGARAAARAAEVALPLLTAEHTLRFARLPAGQDPDDIVRSGGAAAFQAVLDGARPLVDTLFDLLREGAGTTPEARAALRSRLDAAAARIADKTVASEYRTALRDRFFAERSRPGRPGRAPPPRAAARPVPVAAEVDAERARCLVAILLRHPGLLRDVEEAFESLELPPGLDRVRTAMLQKEDAQMLDSEGMVAHLHASGLGDELALVLSSALPLPPSARADAMPAEAEGEWWHLFGLLRGRSRLDQEVALAAQACSEHQTEANTRRLVGLRRAQLALLNLEDDETV